MYRVARSRGVGRSEPGPDVDGGDVVVGVPEPLGVLEDLVGGGRERQRLLQRVAQPQRQLQVLLHVHQGLVGRVRRLYHRWNWKLVWLVYIRVNSNHVILL